MARRRTAIGAALLALAAASALVGAFLSRDGEEPARNSPLSYLPL